MAHRTSFSVTSAAAKATRIFCYFHIRKLHYLYTMIGFVVTWRNFNYSALTLHCERRIRQGAWYCICLCRCNWRWYLLSLFHPLPKWIYWSGPRCVMKPLQQAESYSWSSWRVDIKSPHHMHYTSPSEPPNKATLVCYPYRLAPHFMGLPFNPECQVSWWFSQWVAYKTTSSCTFLIYPLRWRGIHLL